MLHVAVNIQGLDELADAFVNAPELVAREAETAGQEAAAVLLAGIQGETPVVTGDLRDSNNVLLIGPFVLEAEATMPYAAIVHARDPFIDRGALAVEAETDAIYEAAMDRIAEGFQNAQ